MELTSKDIKSLSAEFRLTKEEIQKAWQRFKLLAGQKGYVTVKDLKKIIGDVPIYKDVCQAFVSQDGHINFKKMVQLIVMMREDNPRAAIDHPHTLYNMFDSDQDGLISREEMTEVLFKITNKSLEAMSREQLESAVSQTVLELDQKGKDGLNFNEFEQIFKSRVDIQYLKKF